MISAPDSEKRRVLTSAPQARLVIYEVEEPVYRSVVAVGTLEQISRGDLTVEHIEQYGMAKRPLFEFWGEPSRELEINLYQLEPDDLSGLRIETERTTDSS